MMWRHFNCQSSEGQLLTTQSKEMGKNQQCMIDIALSNLNALRHRALGVRVAQTDSHCQYLKLRAEQIDQT